MLEVGSILDGKYIILNVIGRGGMSVVYLAINERANKTWAVKEVRKDGGNDQSVVSQNLLAETEMLKKLDHPNLPAIVDVIDQDDCFIIVMDYIEGNSLLDLLEERGRQEQDQVVEWAKQLCDVLGYLHTRHPPIIYRDVKPANVMLRPSGNIALVDFGTAREYKQTGEGDTAWLGTRGYAAPEQFGSMGQTDVRTDIYNLGATMFHLITGIVPAGQETFVHPIGEFIPGYAGSGLEKVILKCCRYHPRERYQSCAELMYALDHVHDIDAWEIRKRRAKLFAFGACMALSLVWAAAGFGFRCACAGTRGEMYRRNVSDAMDEPSFSKKTAYYLAAVTLEPGNPEAYKNLIDDVELEPELTDEVYNGVKACIDSRDADPAHRKTAIEFLRKEDPRAYADFNFRFGSLVYLGYPGGKGNAAREYLVNAIDSGGLEGNRLAAAAMMYELADAYRKKIKSDSTSRKKGIEIGEGNSGETNEESGEGSSGETNEESGEVISGETNGETSEEASLEKEKEEERKRQREEKEPENRPGSGGEQERKELENRPGTGREQERKEPENRPGTGGEQERKEPENRSGAWGEQERKEPENRSGADGQKEKKERGDSQESKEQKKTGQDDPALSAEKKTARQGQKSSEKSIEDGAALQNEAAETAAEEEPDSAPEETAGEDDRQTGMGNEHANGNMQSDGTDQMLDQEAPVVECVDVRKFSNKL